MNRINTIIVVSALVTAGLVGLRMKQTQPYIDGGTAFVESPNKLNQAHLSIMSRKRFFGGHENFYTLRVEKGLEGGIKIPFYEQSIPDIDVWRKIDINRLEDTLLWSSDSYSVTFVTGRQDIKVIVPF